MVSDPIIIADPAGSRDNEVRPFAIEGMDVKGRAVRLGTVADQIIRSHDYPPSVARIMGQFLALTALLGSVLKFKGILTLQTKSAGPVPMLVCDYEADGEGGGALRGYGDVDAVKIRQYGKGASFKGLIGDKRDSYLALTIDQGQDMQRYQGIVDLAGDSLADVARNYFQNSEQTPTEIQLYADQDPVTGHWRAGGIMVQFLAHGEEGQQRIMARDEHEHWNRAGVLMHSVKESELLDPILDLDQLLYRLFNEDGVRVFAAAQLTKGCRCSDEKLMGVLSGFAKDDLDHMAEDGTITMDCKFCNKAFKFDRDRVGQ